MAEFSITASVSGADHENAEDVIEQTLAKAAEIAAGSLRSMWPVRTGTSRDGLQARGNLVVGTAAYTDDVRTRGSATPIVDAEAGPIGETAARQALAADDLSEALDGVITRILSESLET